MFRRLERVTAYESSHVSGPKFGITKNAALKLSDFRESLEQMPGPRYALLDSYQEPGPRCTKLQGLSMLNTNHVDPYPDTPASNKCRYVKTVCMSIEGSSGRH